MTAYTLGPVTIMTVGRSKRTSTVFAIALSKIVSLYKNFPNNTLKKLVFTIQDTPGPGSYATVASLDKNSKQLISRFQRSVSPKIKPLNVERPTKHDRVSYHGKLRPGPGYYDSQENSNLMD